MTRWSALKPCRTAIARITDSPGPITCAPTTSESATMEHAPRSGSCRAGINTNYPCWRAATETVWGDSEPTVCAEHAEVYRLVEDQDGYRRAVESVRAYL